jgi:hypothetical protein
MRDKNTIKNQKKLGKKRKTRDKGKSRGDLEKTKIKNKKSRGETKLI